MGRGGHGWYSEHQGRVSPCYPNGVGGCSLDMAELFMRRWPGTFQPPQITSDGLRVEQTWVRGPSLAYTSYDQTSPGPITVIRKIQVKSWNSSWKEITSCPCLACRWRPIHVSRKDGGSPGSPFHLCLVCVYGWSCWALGVPHEREGAGRHQWLLATKPGVTRPG